MKYFKRKSTILLIMLTVFLSGTIVNSEELEKYQIIIKEYATVLRLYVNDKGLVDYKELKRKRKKLDDFIKYLSVVKKKTYSDWNESEKIAFWINTYNAFTLQVIIDHYPLEKLTRKSIFYPQNSIRQIKGVWDEKKITVFNERLSLDGIEHNILRKDFNEPRIHMALVCAAKGCPPLRNEPYYGEKLSDQLNNQTMKFISNPNNFKIDHENKVIYFSAIFKWFQKDFQEKYSDGKEFVQYRKKDRSILKFVSKYMKKEDKELIEKEKYEIKFTNYDWSLNEQKSEEENR